MASALPPTTANINQLLGKLTDADPDFRYMSLDDLLQMLNRSRVDVLYNDYNTAARVVDAVIKALDDQNGEVQNQALKWYVLRWLTPSPPALSLDMSANQCHRKTVSVRW
jgi:cullin-associated NEDD8-dissociated protein 1